MAESKPQVRKLAAAGEVPWVRVGEGEIFVGDLIDQGTDPGAEVTVGFARVAAGESLDIEFPYDEVLVLTKGRYTVTTESGAVITAEPGEAIYLPAGSSNHSHADSDCEMVYVAAPPAVYAAHVEAAAAGVA